MEETLKSPSIEWREWRPLFVKIVFGIWTVAIIPLIGWIWTTQMWIIKTDASRFTKSEAMIQQSEERKRDEDLWKEMQTKADKKDVPSPEVMRALASVDRSIEALNITINSLSREVSELKAITKERNKQ